MWGAQNRGAALRPDLPLPENLDVRHNPVEQKARKVIRKAEADESNQYTDEQGIIYQLDESGEAYAVKGRTDDLKNEIEIASEVNGLPVTSIGARAFNDCSGLTSITIPESVTSIDIYAFNLCI